MWCDRIVTYTRQIELRSDTVTQPDEAMRIAMSSAEVGDDVLDRDPTMQKLEERVAELLGAEAALWVPSGSMGNVVSLTVHLGRGDRFLASRGAHVLDHELGGGIWLSGGVPEAFGWGERPAQIPVDAVRAAGGGAGPYYALRTTLLCLENTHNSAGGVVTPPDEHAKLVATARDVGLRVHLDGARLWHAAVALEVPPAALTVGVATVQVCLSKGLGAPVGSVVAGSADVVVEGPRGQKIL